MILVDVNMQLKEFANGVEYDGKFFPYKVVNVVPAVSPSSNFPKANCRWYIKSCQTVCRLVAGDSTTYNQSYIMINGGNYFIQVLFSVPSAASVQTIYAEVHLLGDRGAPIYAVTDAVATSVSMLMVVAEIDDI